MSDDPKKRKKSRDQMVGRSVVVLTAVFRNQEAIDKLDEAIESLEELNRNMPWLDIGELVEKLKYAREEIDGIA